MTKVARPSQSPSSGKPEWLAGILDLPVFLITLFIFYWSLPICAVTQHMKFWKMRGLRDDLCGWGRMLIGFLRLRIVKLGDEELYRKGTCMYLSNHRSWADFFVDSYITEGRSAILSRLLVAMVFPFFMISCYIIGGVILFKRGTIANKEKFNAWIDSKVNKNSVPCLLVYPEGHRSTAAKSLTLKRGMLHYAYSRKLPVQVVMTASKESCLNEKARRVRFGRTCVAAYSEVMHTSSYPTFDEFAAALQAVWDATWQRVYSADPSGLPEFVQTSNAVDYPMSTRLQQAAFTVFTFVLFLMSISCGTRALSWVLAATGPMKPDIERGTPARLSIHSFPFDLSNILQ